MDEQNSLVPIEVTQALTDADTAALTPVAVYELATKMVSALDLIASLIPDLRTPHPATAKKVRGGRTVSRDAVASIVAMVESFPLLREMSRLDTERAREVLEFDDNFRILEERIERLRRQVMYTVEARWAEIVEPAMAAYAVAKRLARHPENADLAAHVTTVQRHLDRTNTKKQKTAEK